MSSAANLPIALDRCYRNGFFSVRDPGASATISWSNKGQVICEVVTATAESRALPAASGFGVGTRLLVILKVDGGNLTVTGATDGTVTLDTAGDVAEFVVVKTDASDTKAWKQVAIAPGASAAPLVLLSGSGAAPAASGLLIGGGTSANPNLTAVAGANFIELRCKSTGTGSQRLSYMRYDAAGSGSYECVRGLIVATAAASDVTGGSFGAVVSDTGYVTGSCAALAARLEVSDAAVPANGTYYGAHIDLYGDGASSSLAAATQYSILGIGASGNATFVTSVKNAISFDGAASASGGDMISPGTSISTVTGTIRILVNGAVRYLPFYSHEGHS